MNRGMRHRRLCPKPRSQGEAERLRMVYVGPEHRDRRGYFFAAVSLLAGTAAFLPAALPPFGFFAPPLLPGPLSGIVSSSVNRKFGLALSYHLGMSSISTVAPSTPARRPSKPCRRQD